MRIEVVRSAKRRKTVHASQAGGVLRVSIPATMTSADEARWVEEMVRRMRRRSASAEIDLTRRAASLASRYSLARPEVISWADNQERRWGSCTPSQRTVRISTRLAHEPAWVLDYVIVHELAHLDEPDHGPRFWARVERYPLTERARGFLIARSLEREQPGGGGARSSEECGPEMDETDAGAAG